MNTPAAGQQYSYNRQNFRGTSQLKFTPVEQTRIRESEQDKCPPGHTPKSSFGRSSLRTLLVGALIVYVLSSLAVILVIHPFGSQPLRETMPVSESGFSRVRLGELRNPQPQPALAECEPSEMQVGPAEPGRDMSRRLARAVDARGRLLFTNVDWSCCSSETALPSTH